MPQAIAAVIASIGAALQGGAAGAGAAGAGAGATTVTATTSIGGVSITTSVSTVAVSSAGVTWGTVALTALSVGASLALAPGGPNPSARMVNLRAPISPRRRGYCCIGKSGSVNL